MQHAMNGPEQQRPGQKSDSKLHSGTCAISNIPYRKGGRHVHGVLLPLHLQLRIQRIAGRGAARQCGPERQFDGSQAAS